MNYNPNIDKMFEFLYDRQLIYYKKEILKEPRPWTNDAVLDKCKFCNIYRELDRGTKYILNIIQNSCLLEEDLFFNIVAYRVFNLDGLFENIFNSYFSIDNFNFKKYEKQLDSAKERGQTIFSTAYLITQIPWPHKEYRRGEKHPQMLMMLEYLADQISNHKFMSGFSEDKPEVIMEKLQSIPLIGPFLAGQIMVDLSYTDLVPWTGNDFCIIGPGAKTGISQILGYEPKYNELVDFCKFLWENQPDLFRRLYENTGKNWKEIAHKESVNGYPYLSLMDIQHDLCEFRKYNQWNSGEGKKKYY